ncbi:hypothetical protein [Sphingomonas bacterium]|uniref:hypothetical protein n=1 Tax=Sphingomonas bacterium TaxID=1895847 RepID=UPI002630A04B|nr:hypothetical protein [Sphingomonas bacterium]
MTQSIASLPEPFAGRFARPGRRFALLWLVVALLFQGFATQTHAHFGVDRTSAAAASTSVATVAVDGQKQDPAAPACPLCEEKALFGAYLLSGSITIVAPVGVAYHYAAASLPPLALHASSHAWRSRAPPIFTT